jgi:hypothetical protein
MGCEIQRSRPPAARLGALGWRGKREIFVVILVGFFLLRTCRSGCFARITRRVLIALLGRIGVG